MKRYPPAIRLRSRAMRAAGDKLEAISAELQAPRSTIRDWTADMPRRRAPQPPWCPPEWRSYNRHLAWYWKVPLPARQAIIAVIADRPTTKRERLEMVRAVLTQNPSAGRTFPPEESQHGFDKHEES